MNYCTKYNVNSERFFEIVKTLNSIGYSLIEIDSELFIVEEFNPADNNTFYHALRGSRISTFLSQHLINLEGVKTEFSIHQQYSPLVEKIESLAKLKINYSNLYPYILFVA